MRRLSIAEFDDNREGMTFLIFDKTNDSFEDVWTTESIFSASQVLRRRSITKRVRPLRLGNTMHRLDTRCILFR